MSKSKFTPKATVILQFQAGIEVEVVMDGNTMYVPLVTLPDGISAGKETPITASPATPAKPAATPAKATKKFTEDELMEMDTEVLEKMVRKDCGIDPDEQDGKNTNKKLRKIYLEWQAKNPGAAKATPVAEPEAEPVEVEPETTDTDTVEISDLKVDDEVEVFWESFQKVFKGTVCQVKGGKVVVHYEDGDKEVLDPKEHTRIKIVNPA